MIQLKIKVTKEILQRSKYCGISGNALEPVTQNCAIALAVRDVFPKAQVERYYIKGLARTIPIPPAATDFIILFDNTCYAERPLLPEIEFTITIPDEVIEQINIEELRPLLANHPTLELI